MRKRGMLVLLVIIMFSLSVYAEVLDEDGDEYCTGLEGITASGAACPSQLDCNDNNPNINPVKSEVPNDGLDNDCNGIVDDACIDSDNDGYNSTLAMNGVTCATAATLDCDDSDVFKNPGMAEICANSIDDDCDGDIDSADTDCGGVESECTLLTEYTGWFGCDAEFLNEANEGDSAYMILFGENCDSNANTAFKIYEHSEGADTLQDTVEAEEVMANIPDEDGNPTRVSVWIAPWIATYFEDDDDTNPEYFFKAELTEEGYAMESIETGKNDDELLSVNACPSDNPGCGIECVLDINGFMPECNATEEECSGTGIRPPCQATVDCTGAPWSECDAATNMMTRDISACVVGGTGTVDCMESAKRLYPSEKSCSTSANPSLKSSGESLPECGDMFCDAGEEETCPDDCITPSGTAWWIWALIALIVIGLVIGGVVFYKKKKAKATQKPGQKPGEKKDQSPFAQQKDLEAVMGYIRAAKTKGYSDSQIIESLKKSGWKDEQIKYAMEKLKPAVQTAQKSAINPAQQAKPVIQQPGVVKK